MTNRIKRVSQPQNGIVDDMLHQQSPDDVLSPCCKAQSDELDRENIDGHGLYSCEDCNVWFHYPPLPSFWDDSPLIDNTIDALLDEYKRLHQVLRQVEHGNPERVVIRQMVCDLGDHLTRVFEASIN